VKRAIVDISNNRIVSIFERDENLVDLPYVEEAAELEANQILGPAETIVEAGRVVSRRSAIRALSGLVAVVDDEGAVAEVRDLGPELIGVSDNVLPCTDTKPACDAATEVLEGPVVTVEDDAVTRVWSVRKKTAEELAAEQGARDNLKLRMAFGTVGLEAAYEQENRLRKLEGGKAITLEAFKAKALGTLS
jgi:hypothetical protein